MRVHLNFVFTFPFKLLADLRIVLVEQVLRHFVFTMVSFVGLHIIFLRVWSLLWFVGQGLASQNDVWLPPRISRAFLDQSISAWAIYGCLTRCRLCVSMLKTLLLCLAWDKGAYMLLPSSLSIWRQCFRRCQAKNLDRISTSHQWLPLQHKLFPAQYSNNKCPNYKALIL